MARDTAAIGSDVVIGSNTPDVETTVEALIRTYNRWPLNTSLTAGDRIEWDGTNWVPGSGSSVEVIQELFGAAASYDFASIPADYRHLHVVLVGRSDTAAANTTLLMRFNGDATAVYDWQRLSANSATVSSASTVGDTSLQVGFLAAANATAGKAGQNIVDLADYAGTTFHKEFISQVFFADGTAQSNMFFTSRGGLWRSTAAITRVELFPGAGSFVAGSRATLYGIKGAA